MKWSHRHHAESPKERGQKKEAPPPLMTIRQAINSILGNDGCSGVHLSHAAAIDLGTRLISLPPFDGVARGEIGRLISPHLYVHVQRRILECCIREPIHGYILLQLKDHGEMTRDKLKQLCDGREVQEACHQLDNLAALAHSENARQGTIMLTPLGNTMALFLKQLSPFAKPEQIVEACKQQFEMEEDDEGARRARKEKRAEMRKH